MAGPAGSTGIALPAYLEMAPKRSFAAALDWPGWCRSGRTAELALEALAEYAPRYAPIAELAGLDFRHREVTEFDVVEQMKGDVGTEFGVPGQIAEVERSPVGAAEGRRLVALVSASWSYFDRVAAGAPEELRKGPRGGGRNRTKMVGHVIDAEYSYARSMGVRPGKPVLDDPDAVAAMREAVLEALGTPWEPPATPSKAWPPRYAARRIAWHALDHAWEIQDRSTAG